MPKYSGAAYFDLDGTLLDASSEKSLTAKLAKKKPELAKKFGYNPNRIVAKKGGKVKHKRKR